MKKRFLGNLLLSSAAVAGFAHEAHAQETFWNSFLNRTTMTGDWDGGRVRLEDAGISFKASYTGQFADAISGGERQGNGYAQNFSVSTLLDTGKLFGLNGGTITIGFSQRQGRSVSADFIGNRIAVQSAYGVGETLRVAELSYEQLFVNNIIDAKIGFYPDGFDFGYTPIGCDFQNVGFCAHPQNLPAGTAGWADYPAARWGGRIKINVTRDIYWEIGTYDANPTYTEPGNGLKVSTSGSTGSMFPVELGYTPHFGGLPGHYKAGAYYDTSDAPDVTDSAEIDKGRYGFYAMADQMVVSFDGTANRGLIALAQVSYSDPRTSVLQGSWVGAVIAQGISAARPHDYISIGYVHSIINGRRLQEEEGATTPYTSLDNAEGDLEVDYGAQLTPWLQLRPNVQYVVDPGTFSYKHVPNAWVLGLQITANL